MRWNERTVNSRQMNSFARYRKKFADFLRIYLKILNEFLSFYDPGLK
jgi:hypothetical protein